LNRYLAEEYEIEKLAEVLETPLDSYASKALLKFADRGKLPGWTSIKNLEPESSADYQAAASKLAEENEVSRGLLDIIIWRSDKED
jgi:hypothetical protein